LGGGDETLKWTEEYRNSLSQGVTVKNGYFSVALATYCAFDGSACSGGQSQTNAGVSFNQTILWLSMDVGGTSAGAITYDGEMTPFKRLTSAVYSLQAENANTLGGLSSSQYIQNVAPNLTQQTANINIVSGAATTVAAAQIQAVASATAPVLILKGGATPGSGADLLQLQSSSGTLGRISSAGNLYVASSVDVQTGTGLLIGDANATSIAIGKTASNVATTVNGTLVVKPTSGNDSATALQVQIAGGTATVFDVDTTNRRVGVNTTAPGSLVQVNQSAATPGTVTK
jgi:hypothetical protein